MSDPTTTAIEPVKPSSMIAATIEDERRQPLTLLQMRQLLAGLKQDRVAQRSQGGSSTKLSYLQAWDVRRTLIRVFGFGGFSVDLVGEPNIVRLDQVTRATATKSGQTFNWQVTVMSTVRLVIPQLGATYTEAAAAMQAGPDLGEVLDFAVKTSESDAFKRAAMNLGTQFGLSLYNKGATADVVEVVLAPHQKALMDDYHEHRNQPKADIPDNTPQSGSGPVAGTFEDSDEALIDVDEGPTQEQLDIAKGQVSGAFGG